ncbi:glycosyltransferase family 4 protein [Blastopirellula marina]|uniref:Glycosyl transferase, group 1 family protein n=1 Tax=Blastopirellula marina DSM 3645 TaxID=314230 RepID=A3ZZV4_9BACT|nr:glycosyltransferase family 4 protein [Blastopirellula marina]EAQ77895.1 glycosyl transferase, group 1 family protein [Blastopirellula marina DSM 3645]
MPSVLYLCEYATLNGGENSLLSILPHVISSGWRPTILGPSGGELSTAIRAAGAAYQAWDLVDSQGRKRPLEPLRAELAEHIDRRRPDVVHANSLSMSRILGPIATPPQVVKLGHLRDILKLNRRVLDDLNQLHARIAVSQATRDFHVAQGLTATSSHVIYNGVDKSQFFPAAATHFLHAELGLPPETRLLATIGQIGMRKGVDAALRAFAQVRIAHRDAHLLIVGERFSQKDEAIQYEASLHQYVADNQLADAVSFLEFRSDVAAVLRELTMLVHAARQEPLGRVLLEAAATALPVVATDVGGTREIFSHESAEITPVDDVEALAAAITRVLANDDYRSQLRGKSHRRSQKFEPSHSAAEILRLYDDLLSRS